MAVSPDWIPDARHAAVEALRSRSSVDELLALYDHGEVTSVEVSGIVWEHCHDDPVLAANLVESLRRHPNEAGRDVADVIEHWRNRCKQQIKDIEQIRRACPLRPGGNLRLSILAVFRLVVIDHAAAPQRG